MLAYQQCTSPNRQHGGPLNVQVLQPANSGVELPDGRHRRRVAGNDAEVGRARRGTTSWSDNAGTPNADESNVKVNINDSDVRKKSDLSDYTGQLKATSVLRIIDRDNGPSEVGVTQDIAALVHGALHGDGADTTVGSDCSLVTTANSVAPGTVKGNKRTIWQMGKIDLFDGGRGRRGEHGSEHALPDAGHLGPVERVETVQ